MSVLCVQRGDGSRPLHLGGLLHRRHVIGPKRGQLVCRRCCGCGAQIAQPSQPRAGDDTNSHDARVAPHNAHFKPRMRPDLVQLLTTFGGMHSLTSDAGALDGGRESSFVIRTSRRARHTPAELTPLATGGPATAWAGGEGSASDTSACTVPNGPSASGHKRLHPPKTHVHIFSVHSA